MAELDLNGRRLKNIELAILDKDGTLIDLHHYWVRMIANRARHIVHELKADTELEKDLMEVMGIDMGKQKVKTEGPVGTYPREIVFAAAKRHLEVAGFGQADAQKACLSAFERADKDAEVGMQEMVRPLPGAFSMIGAFKKAGCKIAVATADKTPRARRIFKHLGWDNFIDGVIGSDLVQKSKPAPDAALLACKDMGVAPQNAVAIGDSTADMAMSKAAGLGGFIGVCSGAASREELSSWTPHIIDSLLEVGVFTSNE